MNLEHSLRDYQKAGIKPEVLPMPRSLALWVGGLAGSGFFVYVIWVLVQAVSTYSHK